MKQYSLLIILVAIVALAIKSSAKISVRSKGGRNNGKLMISGATAKRRGQIVKCCGFTKCDPALPMRKNQNHTNRPKNPRNATASGNGKRTSQEGAATGTDGSNLANKDGFAGGTANSQGGASAGNGSTAGGASVGSAGAGGVSGVSGSAGGGEDGAVEGAASGGSTGDVAAAGDKGSGTAGGTVKIGSSETGTSGEGESGAGSLGAGTSGAGKLGAGTSGSGTSGAGTTGAGTSGTGTSVAGTFGAGTSGAGISINGTGSTGTLGNGTSANGTLSSAYSGTGTSANGTSDGGAKNSTTAGAGNSSASETASTAKTTSSGNNTASGGNGTASINGTSSKNGTLSGNTTASDSNSTSSSNSSTSTSVSARNSTTPKPCVKPTCDPSMFARRRRRGAVATIPPTGVDGSFSRACNSTFFFGSNPVSWTESYAACQKFGMISIGIGKPEKQKCVSEAAKSNPKSANQSFWTSTHKKNTTCPKTYAMCDVNEVAGPNITEMLTWASDMAGVDSETCVFLALMAGSPNGLANAFCNRKLNIMCEPKCTKPECPTTCSKSAKLFDGNGALIDTKLGTWLTVGNKTKYLFSTAKNNWQTGWEYCCGLGMKLAGFETQEKRKELMTTMRGHTLPETQYWISLTQNNCVGIWSFCNSETILENSIQWAAGQPDNWMGKENHATILINWAQSVLEIYDRSNDDQLSFLCEQPV